ncbi:HesA/MoeB/ThiF family protein [Stigmatella sp. ncwal1]|uniref:HesA/MoeB/ThiF family protein n=1 Tax=Stigmatella ashevillensis TaxID=2995309 RepID=A0ABT5D4R4_9BACT|nr:HesA/MoeB/ThiF family protein [Stigmatella ashevillena]MDC0707823.1 HesA/MoeB/ThiF family protein [Stigmatella ashevillena]
MSHLPEARVLVVGAGGLGCPAALALAHAGVGHLTLVDPDRVDSTRLPQPIWHRPSDEGRPRAESAAEGLARTFPGLSTEALTERVNADNAEALFRSHELVIDATGGTLTPFFLSDVAVLTGVPLVHGSVLRMQGQALRVDPEGPCLRCFYKAPPSPSAAPPMAREDVPGPLMGWVGTVQAMLALERLTGEAGLARDEALLHVFDGEALEGRAVRVRREPDCPSCAPGRWPGLTEHGS